MNLHIARCNTSDAPANTVLIPFIFPDFSARRRKLQFSDLMYRHRIHARRGPDHNILMCKYFFLNIIIIFIIGFRILHSFDIIIRSCDIACGIPDSSVAPPHRVYHAFADLRHPVSVRVYMTSRGRPPTVPAVYANFLVSVVSISATRSKSDL